MQALHRLAVALYLALLLLVLLWEWRWAPATPVARAFWIGLTVVPLLLPLYGIARGRVRAHVLGALVVLLYFSQGVAIAYTAARSGTPGGVTYGMSEAALAVLFVVAASYYVRLKRRREFPATAGTGS